MCYYLREAYKIKKNKVDYVKESITHYIIYETDQMFNQEYCHVIELNHFTTLNIEPGAFFSIKNCNQNIPDYIRYIDIMQCKILL